MRVYTLILGTGLLTTLAGCASSQPLVMDPSYYQPIINGSDTDVQDDLGKLPVDFASNRPAPQLAEKIDAQAINVPKAATLRDPSLVPVAVDAVIGAATDLSPIAKWDDLFHPATVVDCIRDAKARRAPSPPNAMPPALGESCVVRPEDVQRQAVMNSGLASALELENAGRSEGGHFSEMKSASTKLTMTLRKHAADEIRNQEAGLVLTEYYLYAEALAQADLLLGSRRLMDDLVHESQELESKGLEVPKEYPELLREQSKLAANGIEVEMQARQLEEKIRPYTCCRTGKIQPAITLSQGVPEEEQCVACGLATRPDLLFLRTACANASLRTMSSLRGALAATNALLGQSNLSGLPKFAAAVTYLIPHKGENEVERLRDQFHALLADREKKAVSDIRSAVREVVARRSMVALAVGRVELTSKQVAEFEERDRKGLNVREDLPSARRELIKSRSEHLHEIAALEIAGVKLRQAQGLLVREVAATYHSHPEAHHRHGSHHDSTGGL